MNLNMWSMIREYIAAEVQLNVCRHERLRHKLEPCEARAWDEQIARLELQSTRMETAVREMLEQPIHRAVTVDAQ